MFCGVRVGWIKKKNAQLKTWLIGFEPFDTGREFFFFFFFFCLFVYIDRRSRVYS